MKHVDSETYNVAWFKLADYIARGEKERALGVYRLLSHSLDDTALALQLRADILRAFGDPTALTIYQQAAEQYRLHNKTLQAAAVYEHLVTLDPENIAFRQILIELYQQLNIRSKVIEYVKLLVAKLLHKGEWQKAIELAHSYETAGNEQFAAELHEQILFCIAPKADVLADTKLMHAKKAIDAWYMMENDTAIAALITKLKSLNEQIAHHAQAYWDSILG